MSADYVRPVAPINGRMSTWAAHKRRKPPSKEPGVDYYCPIGTPVHAAGDGVVVAISFGIIEPAGRWYAVDLDDGRSYRDLHLERIPLRVGQRVTRGQEVAISGATGYGTEDWSANPDTGGAHVHRTLFPVRYSRKTFANTLDPELYSDHTTGAPASDGNATDLPREEDDMFTDQDRADLALARDFAESAKEGIWNGGRNTDEGEFQEFTYGVLPIVSHSQAVHAAQLAGLAEAIKQLAGGGNLDLDAVRDAAYNGAQDALTNNR